MSSIHRIFRRLKKDSKESDANDSKVGWSEIKSKNQSSIVRSDNPIRRPDEDVLGRSSVAQAFTHQILELDASEGTVVGVLGPWGSGKTSFVNLARIELERNGVPILEFNPWMFSGTGQLVDSFFVELAAQLRIRPGLGEVGQSLADYGEMFSGMGWLPLVGPWIERGRGVIKILGKTLKHRKEGVAARRAKLKKTLAGLPVPILVLIDDIDRLTTEEIRNIFKLVRLTASFPNMIYVVAFDRERVEDALAELGVPGRDYLEKILQIAIDLPAIPVNVLYNEILSGIDGALSTLDRRGPFHEEDWPDAFIEIIRPLVRNMRDVRRYVIPLKGTVKALDGQIALVDVLALEAIRVFLPDVFAQLHDAIDGLTTTADIYRRLPEPPAPKMQIDGLVKAGSPHEDIVQALINRLFPAAKQHIGGNQFGADWKLEWLKNRRVAHVDILRLYLERTVGEGLKSFTDAEKAWSLFNNRNALNDYLRSLKKTELCGVIASLEAYEKEFAPEHVISATIVLYNLLPDLPERLTGMLEIDDRLVVARMAYRILRSLKNPTTIEAAVHQILPELTTLSSKLELITQVGYREGAGHKLVSENAAADFEKSWRSEVRATPIQHLVREWNLGRVLLLTKSVADPPEDPFQIANSPQLTLALLRSVRREVKRQTWGTRAVHRSPQLAWDALIELYGDEATLRSRIESLKADRPKESGDVLELADKYLSGWRPNMFDDV